MGKAWKPHYITAASSSLGRVFTELVTGDPCLSTPSPSSSELTMRLMCSRGRKSSQALASSGCPKLLSSSGLGVVKPPNMWPMERVRVFAATMVTDMEYPARTVYRLLNQLLMQFTENYRDRILSNPKPITKDLDLDFPPMIEFLDKYQDPRPADVAFQIMQDLDQTKEVMYKTIDQVLKRGESLESIMAKSEDLSGASMKFYQTSKKTRCCTIL